MIRTRLSLTSFAKGSSNPKEKVPGCANFDSHHNGCSFEQVGDIKTEGSCLVLVGKRCNYFERAVLPTAGETGSATSIFAGYEKVCRSQKEGEDVVQVVRESVEGGRQCECGRLLIGKQRRCKECARKHSLKNQREYHRERYRRMYVCPINRGFDENGKVLTP